MHGEQLLPHRGDGDAEFLAQLATGGVGVALTGFELAAGELPHGAVALVRGALADEEVRAASDDRGEDADEGGNRISGHDVAKRMR